jgi:hypothetical protein
MPKQQDAAADSAAATVGYAETSRVERRPYQAPTVTKKRSVARVTLFTGGGVSAGGLTASG